MPDTTKSESIESESSEELKSDDPDEQDLEQKEFTRRYGNLPRKTLVRRKIIPCGYYTFTLMQTGSDNIKVGNAKQIF